MNVLQLIFISLLLIGCSPVKNTISHQYRLDQFAPKRTTYKKTHHTILVSPTESVTGYETEEMLYVRKPYTIMPFAKNAWLSPPADMIYPLIMESLEQSGYFKAVASGPYADQSEYRLDSEVLAMQQNFMSRPSHYEMTIKVVLTNVNDNHVVASKVFKTHLPCPSDNPYGGVIAANQSISHITAALTQFVIKEINSQSRST